MVRRLRIGTLKTIQDVSDEYRRVYRATRRGDLDLAEGKSFCWMLKQLSGMISDSDLEQRIEALENAQQSN